MFILITFADINIYISNSNLDCWHWWVIVICLTLHNHITKFILHSCCNCGIPVIYSQETTPLHSSGRVFVKFKTSASQASYWNLPWETLSCTHQNIQQSSQLQSCITWSGCHFFGSCIRYDVCHLTLPDHHFAYFQPIPTISITHCTSQHDLPIVIHMI